ncbi:mycothiol acetyltransferase [Pseudonocardia asaccharolytica DSM 44247 = NBRC 16224]|uniref:Mycothiol acetyltransferase n=1 Tax=Pseudonocardia asaccharolytica DSM 44247 = NBRC 16224 TaxID=1123024 RepID=A0A511D0Y6_9PSEU|nr:mycothiol acetyltransferase [Pseudonocardia asaccharolytica DSM 44247 = NBRC 16224]
MSVAERLSEDRRAAVRALAAAAGEADGTPPLSEQILLNLRHEGADVLHVLAEDPDGGLVGYAQLDRSVGDGGVGELAVYPAHRRRGIGAALLAVLIERAGAPLRVWAHGEHPAAQRLAERYGFSRSRVLWQLRRSLIEPLPPAEFSDDVRVRAFETGRDEAEFLRVNNAAFDWHPEQGGWDVEQVRQRVAEPWFDPDGFLLAVDADDRLLGFHWTKVHPAAGSAPAIGEIYVLGVDPGARGRRLGSALTLAGLRHLRDRGLDAVMLYVEADNAAAVKVYTDLGFTLWHSDVMYLR